MGFPLSRLSLILLSLALLAGCKSGEAGTSSTGYEYRKDELALLQIATDNVQQLEQEKQYGKIYDDYASPTLQKTISRRRFLMMTHCVEQELGELVEFERHQNFVRREENGQTIDMGRRTVRRTGEGKMQEEFDYVQIGAEYRLNGIYWITANKGFLQCIQDITDRSRRRARQEQRPLPAEPTQEEQGDGTVRLGTSGEQSSAEQSDNDTSASPEASEPASEDASELENGQSTPE